jgi:hypothetical protein
VGNTDTLFVGFGSIVFASISVIWLKKAEWITDLDFRIASFFKREPILSRETIIKMNCVIGVGGILMGVVNAIICFTSYW